MRNQLQADGTAERGVKYRERQILRSPSEMVPADLRDSLKSVGKGKQYSEFHR